MTRAAGTPPAQVPNLLWQEMGEQILKAPNSCRSDSTGEQHSHSLSLYDGGKQNQTLKLQLKAAHI